MDRRRFLAGTAVLALLPFDRAAATPDSMTEAIRKVAERNGLPLWAPWLRSGFVVA